MYTELPASAKQENSKANILIEADKEIKNIEERKRSSILSYKTFIQHDYQI